MAVPSLDGCVALVTGASRGIGKGVAIGLGEAGATVFVTGRTMREGAGNLAGSLPETAAMVTTAGGRGIALRCDHRRDEQIEDVFATIESEEGRLDLLVNNVTAVSDLRVLFSTQPFWELPPAIWDDLFAVGLRSHFIASQHAARLMVANRRGLIVNISSAGAQTKIGVLPYGVAKAAVDRMTSDMASDLLPHGVAALSLWPPPTSTERMLESVDEGDDPSKWSRPVFVGRVVAALAADPEVMKRSGGSFRARQLAAEFGIADDLFHAGQSGARPGG
jgi:dehydrogenase/reductase SDR family member 1